jgi:hypothetical protein
VRAPARLAMEIKLSGKDYARVESINVSANGVYFASSRPIPLLTKLAITLLLPNTSADDAEDAREVACEGVVVRAEPEKAAGKGPYQIACYFTSISPDDRDDLETYILGQMAF